MEMDINRPALESDLPPPPDNPPPPTSPDGWAPKLNPTQQKVFDDRAAHILMYGEKYSGKGIGGLMSLIRHCYEEEDALALMFAPALRTGNEGVMADLVWALDIWKNGNWVDKKMEARLDSGMGLEYTQPSMDPKTKDTVLYIGNQWNGWGKVMLVSIPYGAVVEKRMRGMSPSFVYIDEITKLDGREYFTYIALQIGRKRGIRGPQQYLASCNPEGPSHWLYKIFFVDCIDKETGARKPRYSVYHIPSSENEHNAPDDYLEKVKEVCVDEFDYRRLVLGEWVDRPSGEAIFRDYFVPEIHVRPTLGTDEHRRGYGLMPTAGFPILMGWDMGPANFCIAFMQMVVVLGGIVKWKVFSEFNRVGMKSPDTVVLPMILRMMDYWQTKLGSQAKFIHLAETAAFTIMRPDGSYDARRIQELSKNRIRFRRAIPEGMGKHSVPGRVTLIRSLFLDETLFISAACPKTIESCRLLESEKVAEGKYDPNKGLMPQRSIYIHPFDAMSYPPFAFSVNPTMFTLQTAKVESGVFRAGGGGGVIKKREFSEQF